MSPRILVFGRSGQVAQALARMAPAPFEWDFAGRERLDLLARPDDAAELIAAVSPAAVINAAAFTLVDKAEEELEACRLLNAAAPAVMARACAAADIPFVHFSTDYVFDGAKGAAYVEDDAVSPLSAYGRTKAEGEVAVAEAAERFAIIRTSAVYSPWGQCFPATMLRLAAQRDELSVIDDQRSCPTAATQCAKAAAALTAQLLDGDASAQGLFHAAGERGVSWADFAELILARSARRGGPSARVRRITAREWNAAAARPADSRLASDKLERITPWRRGELSHDLDDWFENLGN